MPNIRKTTKKIAFSYLHGYNSKNKATIIFWKICDSGECSPLQEKINKFVFWVRMWPRGPCAQAHTSARPVTDEDIFNFHIKNIIVIIFSWILDSGECSPLQGKKYKIHQSQIVSVRSARASAHARAPVTDEVHICEYPLNYFESYHFYFFTWKLVIFPFFSYILHIILLYFNIWNLDMEGLRKFVNKSKLFKLLSKSLYFLEIIFFLGVDT